MRNKALGEAADFVIAIGYQSRDQGTEAVHHFVLKLNKAYPGNGLYIIPGCTFLFLFCASKKEKKEPPSHTQPKNKKSLPRRKVTLFSCLVALFIELLSIPHRCKQPARWYPMLPHVHSTSFRFPNL